MKKIYPSNSGSQLIHRSGRHEKAANSSKKGIITIGLILTVLFFFSIKPVFASENVSGGSASFSNDGISVPFERGIDNRLFKLKSHLENYRSPLYPYSQYIIELADKYGLPWNLVVAIAGVESGFCRNIPENSFNCWGFDNGNYSFKDYKNALEEISLYLKNYYYDRGYDTPEKISPIYAPPSTTWAGKVRHFMNLIESNPSDTSIPVQISL
jgi:hypothetical protein